jgi:acetoacetyl-CoA synthetase
MPLFVVLREGASLDSDLIAAVKKRIREDCSPRHTPNEVIAIAEVPRTLSGKVLEVPVKRILMGESPDKAAARDSLQNPASLDYFVELAASSADGAASGGRSSSA